MRFIKSFGYAWKGLSQAILREPNFRVQSGVAFFTFLLAGFLHISALEWIAVLLCTMIVLGLEMINSSIEKLADHVCQQIHPQIKMVKDIAAGAVLLACTLSFVAGAIIFIPKLKAIFFS